MEGFITNARRQYVQFVSADREYRTIEYDTQESIRRAVRKLP